MVAGAGCPSFDRAGARLRSRFSRPAKRARPARHHLPERVLGIVYLGEHAGRRPGPWMSDALVRKTIL